MWCGALQDISAKVCQFYVLCFTVKGVGFAIACITFYQVNETTTFSCFSSCLDTATFGAEDMKVQQGCINLGMR
jgi:hypothetical protein